MIGPACFATIGILFLLSAIHVFTATLYQSLFGRLPNTTLGALAFLIFGLSLLAVVTARRLGPRRSVAWTAAFLAIAMLVVTTVRQEWIDLVLSGAAVVAGTQWLSLAHATRTTGRASPLPIALPVALVIDLVLRSAFATIPIVGAPLALAVPLVLVAALLFLAAGIATVGDALVWATPTARGALGLVAVGPLLLAAETGGLNGAQAALAGGLGLDGGPSTQIGLLVVGIGAAAGAIVLARGVPARPSAAAAIAVGAALLWLHVPVLSLAAAAAFAAGIVIAASALTSAPLADARSAWLTIVAFGIGWLLFVGGTFVHYAYFANREALWLLTALVVVAVLLVPPSSLPRLRLLLAGTVAGLAVLVPAVALALTPAAAIQHAPLSFRVMTYNVHQGFDVGDVPALDRIADTISREGPDVVVLEEVVRGWLIDDQQDVIGYLAGRLAMAYVYGPNVGDLYGNAILSRYPLTDVRRVSYPKEPGLRYQPRGAVLAHIGDDATAVRVLIAVTHLDENSDASAVRMEQVRALLNEVGTATPAIIGCDCNARPDAPELKLITDSGFGDLALQSGGGDNTYPSDSPVERIDYLFGVGVTAAQGHVVASTASDHRGVVVNITLTGR
ncbi:MAG: endonuclease/exonuclease/phosphatase family protein [Chloroflexota bacterium]|nr:endonuclease/exonuclease/phosphatase family protein [Chloroflexota bacterium]